MKIRKRILFIFPYEWLAYFPTFFNLRKILEKDYQVTAVTFSPAYFGGNRLDGKNIYYTHVPGKLTVLVKYIDKVLRRFGLEFPLNEYCKALALYIEAKKHRSDIVIGADTIGLWVAQRLCKEPLFLSVDIDDDDPMSKKVNYQRVKAVLTASEERYAYLFKESKRPHFIIPNSQIYRERNNDISMRHGLIYSGSALPQWGIFSYLEFVSSYPEFSLTLVGAIPQEVKNEINNKYESLLDNGRLNINNNYIDSDQLIEYIAQFRIGFCMYNVDKISPNKKFNQLTGSYGKLYTYYAAGIPVIASSLPGMKSVEEFNTGVLVDDSSAVSIKKAIDIIQNNYSEISENCLCAARHFSFDKAAIPLNNYLNEK